MRLWNSLATVASGTVGVTAATAATVHCHNDAILVNNRYLTAAHNHPSKHFILKQAAGKRTYLRFLLNEIWDF